MKHLGDITKIRGYDAPTVNVVIGGSPCQDLSLAGKRAGLSGARSGLFMEQIRIIKEMREKDARSGRTGTEVRPRFMVWENVPGAFSVNGGADFAAVLEETIRVAEPEAPDIPVPRNGWTTAGAFMGRGWSVAWRVLDAQYWGVPQRRRRIALVADFGGQSAPEILFKPKSVSGHFEPCGEAWKGTVGDVEGSAGNAVTYGICSYESNAMKSDNPSSGIYEADTSRTLDNNGGNPACNQGGIAVVCLNDQGGSVMEVSHDVTGTIRAQEHGHQPIAVYENHAQDSRYGEVGDTAPTCTARYGTGGGNMPIVVSIGNGQMDNMSMSETANTLDCMHDQQAVMISFDRQRQGMYGESGVSSTLTAHEGKEGNDIVVTAVDFRNGTEDASTNGTLQAKSNGGTSLNLNNICRTGYTVRRLTPTECERLQGFPDGWTDIGEWTDSTGKKRICSDSARYKALGNSIAIPPWLWVCDQLGEYLGEDKTMASLFDGIAGFPLIWSYLYGRENVLWASEIDDFPMAVTRLRFPD